MYVGTKNGRNYKNVQRRKIDGFVNFVENTVNTVKAVVLKALPVHSFNPPSPRAHGVGKVGSQMFTVLITKTEISRRIEAKSL